MPERMENEKSPSLPPGTPLGGSQREGEMQGRGPVKWGFADISSEQQCQGGGPCWVEKLMKRWGLCCILIWNSGHRPPCRRPPPYSVSLSQTEPESFLSTNILNSRVTRKGTRGRSLAAIQQATLQPGTTHIQAARLETTLEPGGLENTSKVRRHLVSKGGRPCSLGP